MDEVLHHPYFWELDQKYHVVVSVAFFSAIPADGTVGRTFAVEKRLDGCQDLPRLVDWMADVRARFNAVREKHVLLHGQCYSTAARQGRYTMWSDLLRFMGSGFKHPNGTGPPLLELFPDMLISLLRMMAIIRNDRQDRDACGRIKQWLDEEHRSSTALHTFFDYLRDVE